MEKNSGFLYILRYAVEPGFHEDEKLEELASFCASARIDDVMFFINCEELNQGHLTLEETVPWLEVIQKGKSRLEPLGITTSINPWITTLHTDRGRRLKEGQDFRLMVDPLGQEAQAVVCPLDENWRTYLAGMYALYATLKPYMLWVEDDFRLHNHAPLHWGGCFCDAHMELYSQRAGRKLTRSEFVEGLLKPGRPHPYRKIWLETARDTMVELAGIIGRAVHKLSPETRIGLMSSSPAVHCGEGRDWKGILKGLAGDTPMVNRPHLPAYSEVTPQSYTWGFNAISRYSRAMVPAETEIYPELESFPHTRFSKSKAFTRYQLETSLALESHGITLNIFDMMGNGIMMEEGYQEILAQSKDFLSAVKNMGLSPENQLGIRVLVSPESSFTLHTEEGKEMTDLYPKESFWAGLLSSYGIACTYSGEKEQHGRIVAVSGQYFRNLAEGELKQLFEDNFVLMDGEAAWTLMDMGMGHLAGMKNAFWHEQDSGFQAYEQICDGKNYHGIMEGRISAQGQAGRFLEIEYADSPLLKTVMKNPGGMTVAPGMVVINDRVFILPYGCAGGNYQSHLNPLRQEILQDVLLGSRWKAQVYCVRKSPFVSLYVSRLTDGTAFILTNGSGDDEEEVGIHMPESFSSRIMEVDHKDGKLVPARAAWKDGDLILQEGLKRMEVRVFVIAP